MRICTEIEFVECIVVVQFHYKSCENVILAELFGLIPFCVLFIYSFERVFLDRKQNPLF